MTHPTVSSLQQRLRCRPLQEDWDAHLLGQLVRVAAITIDLAQRAWETTTAEKDHQGMNPFLVVVVETGNASASAPR
jgi:hypothetical protein